MPPSKHNDTNKPEEQDNTVGKDVGRLDVCALSVGMGKVQTPWEKKGSSTKSEKQNCIHSWEPVRKSWKQDLGEEYAHPCSRKQQSQQQKWEQPGARPPRNRSARRGGHIQ